MGINTAFKLVGEHKLYKKCLLSIQQKNFEIPSDFDEKFQLAFLTFRFQYVYCPLKEKIVHLHSFDLDQLRIQYVDKAFHNTNSQINWKNFEENVLITPLIFKILSKDFKWSFLGDMDEATAIKVAKYQIDPTTLEPYKQVKFGKLALEGSLSAPVRMGNGGLSSLQNKNIFEKKYRSNKSTSDSILQGQSTLNNFLKIEVKSGSQKSISNDDSSNNKRLTLLMEDANSNSNSFSKSKFFDKQQNNQSKSQSQDSIDTYSKNIINKYINLIQPFKPPTYSNVQKQQTDDQLTKKKSILKKNMDYFDESDEEQEDIDENINAFKMVESQILDAAFYKKENSSNINQRSLETNNKNQNESIENDDDIQIEGDDGLLNFAQSLNKYKSNSLINKKIDENQNLSNIKQQKYQSGVGQKGLKSVENQKLTNKLQKKLIIDKTPINEIKMKYPQSLLKKNVDLNKDQNLHNNSFEEEQNEECNLDLERYENDYQLIQREEQIQTEVLIKKGLSRKRESNNTQEENKSFASTQSQRNQINNIEILSNNDSVQSQKQTQKTSSRESSASSNKCNQEPNDSILCSTEPSTKVNSEQKSTSRLDNFSEVVDGNVVVDSQYLLNKHPEYNFLEKFSIFFNSEINI